MVNSKIQDCDVHIGKFLNVRHSINKYSVLNNFHLKIQKRPSNNTYLQFI